MIAMGCVNCGAKLDITPDLDVFACGYCGSQQRVERRGGIVALRKIESAIKAVQRGTDKTAAELAIPRLERELAEAETRRARSIQAAAQALEIQKRDRLMYAVIAFIVLAVSWSMFIQRFGEFPGKELVFLAVVFGLPAVVFVKTKIKGNQTARIIREFEEEIDPIREKLAANRAIANE